MSSQSHVLFLFLNLVYYGWAQQVCYMNGRAIQNCYECSYSVRDSLMNPLFRSHKDCFLSFQKNPPSGARDKRMFERPCCRKFCRTVVVQSHWAFIGVERSCTDECSTQDMRPHTLTSGYGSETRVTTQCCNTSMNCNGFSITALFPNGAHFSLRGQYTTLMLCLCLTACILFTEYT